MNIHINKIFIKRPGHIFWFSILWMAIFFPSSVEAESFRCVNMRPEVNTSILEFNSGRFEQFQNIFFDKFFVVFDKRFKFPQFACESGAEGSGSPSELLPSHDINISIPSKFIADNFSNNPSDKCTYGETNYKLKHWHYLAIGFGLGGWFAIFCIQILPLFIYTQQLNVKVKFNDISY